MKIRVKLLILFIIVGIGAAVAINMGWLEWHDVPGDVRDQIEALSTLDYEVDSIKDTGKTYKIKLEMRKIPTLSTDEIENWTTSVCIDVNRILLREDIKRNIEVEARKKFLGGDIDKYGKTYYDKDSHRYEFTEAK